MKNFNILIPGGWPFTIKAEDKDQAWELLDQMSNQDPILADEIFHYGVEIIES